MPAPTFWPTSKLADPAGKIAQEALHRRFGGHGFEAPIRHGNGRYH